MSIARTLAVGPERFARLERVDGATEGDIMLGREAVGGRLVLRRRPDGAGRTRCVFLVTAGSGRKVCGLGAMAPSACKAFPAPHVGPGPTRVAGCWRTWEPSELPTPTAPERASHEAAIGRWHLAVGERSYPLPEAALLHSLLADAALASGQPEARGGADDALPEPRSSSGCATCTTSRCCIVFDPELTGADLVRLIDALGLAAGDIAELKPTREDQAGADAVHLGDARAWDLRLRRTAALAGFQGPGGHRRCGFLVDLTHPELPAASRCGVYAQRPLVCRLFPSDLTAIGVMVGTPEAICPPQAWSQERSDLQTLHHLHLVARDERERFRSFLRTWNRDAHVLVGRPHDERMAAFFEALVAHERETSERSGLSAEQARPLPRAQPSK